MQKLRQIISVILMIIGAVAFLGVIEVIDAEHGLSATVLSISLGFICLGCASILQANDHIPAIYQFSIMLLWSVGLMLIPLFLAFIVEEPPESHQYQIMFWLGTPCIVMAATAITWYRHQMEVNEPSLLDQFDAASQIKMGESAETPPPSLNIPRCLTIMLILLLVYTVIIDLIILYNRSNL